MGGMVMDNNELKNRIQKNVKENIAISNIREEIDMNNVKNKKVFYGVLSSCAMIMLCAVVIVNSNIKFGDKKNSTMGINDKYAAVEDLEKENLKVELNINKIDKMGAMKLDAEEKLVNNVSIPYFDILNCLKVPNDFDNTIYRAIYVKSNQTKKNAKYDKLNNYEFVYYNTRNERCIVISFSDENKPLRDYHFGDDGTPSKINDFELVIYQYENLYMTEFNYKGYNFDIETTDITESELSECLQSILIENPTINKPVDDKDVNVSEQPSENINKNYPEYYAGKYVDHNGNNVVLLCEDSKLNRKEICNLLGITESKTIFKTAKYSYNYLTDLQRKISKAMQNKELTFVTTSAVMEDSNNIRVTVTSNNESDLNKIKALDTIGGAIDIQYNTNSNIKKDLLVKTE